MKRIVAAALLFLATNAFAQGTLILTGGDFVDEAVRRFVTAAGGENSNIVYIPTAASELKLPSEFIHNPDSIQHNAEFAAELGKLFHVKNIIILHTRDPKVANSKEFASALDKADGVWIGPGNSGRLTDAYLNTLTHTKLKDLLVRGKVVGGNSAGAIITGSFIVRGRADKPLLMPKGRTTGFGFITNIVINPHIISAKRENELVDVLDAHNELLGIGLDDNSAIEIKNRSLEVIGPGRVAIYDNIKHGNGWYYWLITGDHFNITYRRKE